MENQITITIDLDESLIQEGKKFVFKREVEEQILKFLEMREKVEEQYKQLKIALAEAGTSIDPSFKGIVGEKIKAIFRSYGSKYAVTPNTSVETLEEMVRKGLITEHKIYKVDSAKVDKYVEVKGAYPENIEVNDREPVISLSIIDGIRALP